MGDSHPDKSSPSLLMRKLLSCFSLEWISGLVDLYHTLRKAFTPKSPEGMYEILDYDSTLELMDSKGKTAVFKRHQKVKFCQDHIIAFQDHAWGTGDIFADYKVSKGVAVDRYQDGDRWNILISLRETKSKGDVEDFYFERTAKNGFTQGEEWWQVEVWYKTQVLDLTIFFPQNRHCKRAVLQERTKNKTVVLGHEHFKTLPDGRQRLHWEAKNPRYPEIYTIRWAW